MSSEQIERNLKMFCGLPQQCKFGPQCRNQPKCIFTHYKACYFFMSARHDITCMRTDCTFEHPTLVTRKETGNYVNAMYRMDNDTEFYLCEYIDKGVPLKPIKSFKRRRIEQRIHHEQLTQREQRIQRVQHEQRIQFEKQAKRENIRVHLKPSSDVILIDIVEPVEPVRVADPVRVEHILEPVADPVRVDHIPEPVADPVPALIDSKLPVLEHVDHIEHVDPVPVTDAIDITNNIFASIITDIDAHIAQLQLQINTLKDQKARVLNMRV